MHLPFSISYNTVTAGTYIYIIFYTLIINSQVYVKMVEKCHRVKF